MQNPRGDKGGAISIWTQETGGIQVPLNTDIHITDAIFNGLWNEDEVTRDQTLALWVQGDSQNDVGYTEANDDEYGRDLLERPKLTDVLHKNVKPSTSLTATLKTWKGTQYTPDGSDTVSYIVAYRDTFWYEVAYSPDLRAALAAKLVYNADGSKTEFSSPDNFGLEPVTSRHALAEVLGFENFKLERGVFGIPLPFFGGVSAPTLDILSGSKKENELDGLGVRLYFDHLSQRYILAFKGSDADVFANLDDWVNNNATQGAGWGTFARQYQLVATAGSR